MADVKPNSDEELRLLDDLVVPEYISGRVPGPELFEFLRTVVLPQIKTKSGKSALKEQQRIYNDHMVLESVRWWREQRWHKVPREVSEAKKIVKDWKRLRGLPPSVSAALEIVKQWRRSESNREHTRNKRKWRAWVSRHSWKDFGKLKSERRSRPGRPKGPPRAVRDALDIVKQWSDDGCVSGEPLGSPAVRRAFAVVKEWRDHGIKKARHRKFSDTQIREMVGKELHMSPSSVWRASKDAEKRNKEGFYISELFMQSPYRPL